MVVGNGQHAAREGGSAAVVGGAALPPLTEQEFLRLLTELSVDFAPQRFALCEVDRTRQDGWVFGWGMALDDLALLFAADGQVIGRFPSAERALAALSRCADLHLVWIDDEQHGAER